MMKFRCIRSTSSVSEVREFTTREEAYRFVMREGDASRLWTMESI